MTSRLGSFLLALDEPTRVRLLADAVRVDVPAGSVLYRDGEASRMGVVTAGLLRVYLTSAEGRQVTVRYVRDGDVLGTVVAVIGSAAVSVQAITDATLLIVSVDRVRALGQADARFAWTVAEEVARRLNDVLEAFAGTAFGSVRQRLARHLLDLAAQQPRGEHLLAPVSQQELADAVGSVREVVTRVLREMREEGLVDTTRQGIVLLDPAGLSAQVES
jgi:CRP/FNR family transcriptional regulator, cyclic AMP receptor protein